MRRARYGRHQTVVSRTPEPYDAVACEAVELLTATLRRCGTPPRAIERMLRDALTRTRHIRPVARIRASLEYTDAAHVVTVWHSDPRYFDASGRPRPLKLSGASPSFATLVRQAGSLSVEEAKRCLLKMKMIRRSGAWYIPRRRVGHLRGLSEATHFRDLRATVVALRTLQHNLKPRGRERPWFQYIAEKPRFPAAALPGFDGYVHREGMGFLKRADARMERAEARRKSGQRTVRVGVGMFWFEEPTSRRSRRG